MRAVRGKAGFNAPPKKTYIKIITRGVPVRIEPARSSKIIASLQTGQLQAVSEQIVVDDVIWFHITCGWMCSRDANGFLCSQASNEVETNKYWAAEYNNRRRLSCAIANVTNITNNSL
jgi:hypothetical protein